MSDVDYFLAHFGRKGMKWGVVNEDDAPMRKASDKYFAKTDQKLIDARGRVRSLEKTKAVTSDVKDDGPTADNVKQGRLSRTQKIALGVGATVAVAGLAYYGNQHLNNRKAEAKRVEDLEFKKHLFDDKVSRQKPENRAAARSQMDALFGPSTHQKAFDDPKAQFHMGLKSKKALDRPEFTIPKGTVFQRISHVKESGDGYAEKGAFASFLPNDNLWYQNGRLFGAKDNMQRINFEAGSDIRVPALKTVLRAVQEYGDGAGKKYSAEEAFKVYADTLAGSKWDDDRGIGVLSTLKKQGYSALVDDMDAGFQGDLPMFFFGTPKNMTYTDHKNDIESQRERSREFVNFDGRYA